jgi:hypothetical protein
MSFTWCPKCGSPFSNPHRGMNDAIRDQKKLSEFEVAQLERLTRRMDDWQRGGLWLWLNGGFLRDRSLWDALTSAVNGAVNSSCVTFCSKNFGQYY